MLFHVKHAAWNRLSCDFERDFSTASGMPTIASRVVLFQPCPLYALGGFSRNRVRSVDRLDRWCAEWCPTIGVMSLRRRHTSSSDVGQSRSIRVGEARDPRGAPYALLRGCVRRLVVDAAKSAAVSRETALTHSRVRSSDASALMSRTDPERRVVPWGCTGRRSRTVARSVASRPPAWSAPAVGGNCGHSVAVGRRRVALAARSRCQIREPDMGDGNPLSCGANRACADSGRSWRPGCVCRKQAAKRPPRPPTPPCSGTMRLGCRAVAVPSSRIGRRSTDGQDQISRPSRRCNYRRGSLSGSLFPHAATLAVPPGFATWLGVVGCRFRSATGNGSGCAAGVCRTVPNGAVSSAGGARGVPPSSADMNWPGPLGCRGAGGAAGSFGTAVLPGGTHA